MPKYLVTLLTFLVASCSACPGYADTIGVHLASVHSSGDFNNINPGGYYIHDGWTVGSYYNSERRQSAYAGYTFERGHFALTVGAITGYAAGKVLPLAVPSFSFQDTTFGGKWRIMFVPKVNQYGAAALHLTHEWSLK